MLYQIANFVLKLEGIESDYLKHRMNAYSMQDNGDIPVDLHVTFKENNCIEVPAGRDFRRLDAWYWIDRGLDGYSAIKQAYSFRGNFMRMDLNRECTKATIEYVDIGDKLEVTCDVMLHYALGDLFAFCQTFCSATVLHSTAVTYKGQAVLFSAPSETGKSTHSGLWKKFYPDQTILFNDDTPVIRKEHGDFYAYGSPWSGKTEINENIGAPLAGIVFLKQAKENTIRRLSTVEAVVKLMNETKKPVFESIMAKHMDILNDLIVSTPIYELGCTISKEAVDLVKDTLFQE